jgi:hypothetical protein
MCYGGEAALKLINYMGESLTWIYRDVASPNYQTITNAGADTYTVSTLTFGLGTYDVRVIVSAGCDPDTSAAMRVVVKAPVNINLTVDGNSAAKELPNFCKGNELVLKVNGLSSASDTWTGTITNGTATTTYSGSGEYWRVNTAGVQAPGTYTYSVTYTDAFCPPSQSGTITVGYSDAPGAGTLTPELTEFCNADTSPKTLTLSGNSNSATIKGWEYKSLATTPGMGPWGSSGGAGASTMSVAPLPGTYVFRVVVQDPTFGACSVTYSNEVKVIKYEVPRITEGSNTYRHCEKVDVKETFTSDLAGVSFEWSRTLDGGGTPDKTGTGAINETLVYNGDNINPQTYTYTITPVIGTKEKCPGTPITITYILWPKFEVTLDPNSITELSCYGATDGRLIYNVLSPSTFTLFKSDGQQTGVPQMGIAATFTGLGIGSYTLEVKNGNCTTDLKNIVISGPSHPLEINNALSEPPFCYGGATGVITFDIAGGTMPYKASINNRAYEDVGNVTRFQFPGLAAGVYSVKVQDANGCIAEKTIRVEERPELTLAVEAITPVSAAGARDATATLRATGGSGSGYRYSATGLDNDFSSNRVV